MEVEVGQIWIVINDFWTSGNELKLKGRDAKVLIKAGEKLEVRHPYKWHLRTFSDDIYLHIDEEVLIDDCLLFGVINKDVRFNNGQKLKEIIEKNLYVPANKLLTFKI